MIPFICDKSKWITQERVSRYLAPSFERNHFANGGPCVLKLEERLRELLIISDKKAVIAACSGTAALHGLIGGLSGSWGRLKLGVQSFTFPCHQQQVLSESVPIDIDEEGGLDLARLQSSLSGVIVTNCFGHIVDIEKYEGWRRGAGKLLIFDNAATPATFINGVNSLNYGDGAVISLHHTKPLGFSEGGAIVVDRLFERAVRQCIGYKTAGEGAPSGEYASNFKMSDVCAAYILSILDHYHDIVEKHMELYAYAKKRFENLPGVQLYPSSVDPVFSNCLPVLFNHPVDPGVFLDKGVVCHKYYRPLIETPVASDFYNRILCLPLHYDLTEKDMDLYWDVFASL